MLRVFYAELFIYIHEILMERILPQKYLQQKPKCFYLFCNSIEYCIWSPFFNTANNFL